MPRPPAALRRINVLGVVTLVVLLGAWETLVRSGLLDFQNLPAPSAVAARLEDLLASGELVANLLHTLRVTLLGWVLAAVGGITLGVVLGVWYPAWRWSMASIEVLRAVPPITLVPLALVVFGFSVRTELTLIVYASAWPVLVNTIDGVRSVTPELREVGRTLKMSRGATLRKITLPAAVPSIVVGLQLALSLALVLAVVAELVGNPSGLGNALILAQLALQPEEMFAYVFTIGLLGITLNVGFRQIVSWTLPAVNPRPGRVK